MKRPSIGITMYADHDVQNHHLPIQYAKSIYRAGGMPYLIPPLPAQFPLPFDGVLLAGGGDIHPDEYGGQLHESLYGIDKERDEAEIAIIQYLLKNDVPTLGICRGTQLLNVAMGGSMIQHLNPEKPGATLHRNADGGDSVHQVEINQGSLLADALGCTECAIVSKHHQAIKEAAPLFEVVAFAPDGVIEAIESREHKYLLGVQWHPELSAKHDPIQQKLFDHFVAAVARNN